jgi:ribosomal protein S18 acetylase RimI-like enzyme
MSDPTPLVRLRQADQNDVPFIFNSWLKSYRDSSTAKLVSNTVFFSEHHKLIERIVKHNPVILAVNDADPTQIYGYICAGVTEGIFTLHYIYVKHNFRNLGIGKALLNAFEHDLATAGIYTHHTKIADKIASKYNFLYHPYVLHSLDNK